MFKKNVKLSLIGVMVFFVVVSATYAARPFTPFAHQLAAVASPLPERVSVPMTVILQRAADYCEKLKSAAFYYFCIEDITEISNQYPKYRDFRQKGKRDKLDRKVNHYVYDYQILKKDATVKEKRVLTEKNGKKMNLENAPLLTRYAYSYRSFYGPITLLSKERQRFFNYKILKRYNGKKGRIVVIEARPNKRADRKYNYGKVWLSVDTGEVFRIEVDGRSTRGTEGMKQIAKKYGASPDLMIIHEYDVQNNGLRYPGRTQFIESYSGGANLSRKFKDGRYVRSDTTYSYKDYRFFNIDVKMKIEE